MRVKNLAKEIKLHLSDEKRKRIRQGIIPGNSKTLWDSVKLAKDMNIDELPTEMHLDNEKIEEEDIADAFADFFENKIKDLLEEISIDDEVYNGERKIHTTCYNFMTSPNIEEAIRSLKIKKLGRV